MGDIGLDVTFHESVSNSRNKGINSEIFQVSHLKCVTKQLKLWIGRYVFNFRLLFRLQNFGKLLF